MADTEQQPALALQVGFGREEQQKECRDSKKSTWRKSPLDKPLLADPGVHTNGNRELRRS